MFLFQTLPDLRSKSKTGATPVEAPTSRTLTALEVAKMPERDCSLLVSISNSGNQQLLPPQGPERSAVLQAVTTRKMQLHCPEPSSQPTETSKPLPSPETKGFWEMGMAAVRFQMMKLLLGQSAGEK